MAVIYRITNMTNNHYYIGSAESFARREWQHKYDLKRGAHKNPHLQAAWNKYGADAFVFEVIEDVPSGVNPLQIEDIWLVQCVGKPECYNINACAESPRSGMVLSAESREKVSLNRKGKAAGKEHYRYGKTLSDEIKAKIGATQKGKAKASGRKVSEEGLAKIKANIEAGRSHMHWLGKQHTEDAKAKMSRPVVAVSPTAVETVYASITALRDALGLKPPTANRALKSGEPLTRGKFAGWKFAYVASTEPA